MDVGMEKQEVKEKDAGPVAPPKEKVRPRKALWYFAIFLVVSGFICHISVQLSTFLAFNVLLTGEVHARQAAFPQVIVCLPTYFGVTRTKLFKYHDINYKDTVFEKNLVRVWNCVINDCRENGSLLTPANIAAAKLTFLPKLSQLAVGSTAGDVITSCRYDDRVCDFRNFTSFYSAEDGLCISFLPQPGIMARFQDGISRGLALNLMYEDKALPIDTSRRMTDLILGYKISVHPPDAWPLTSAPQAIGQTRKQLLVTFTHKQLVYLSRPRHPCLTPAPRRRLCRLEFGVGLRCRSFVMTEALDALVRHQELLARRCNCVTYEWPITEGTKDKASCHALPDAAFLAASVNSTARTVEAVGGDTLSLDALLPLVRKTAEFRCYQSVKEMKMGANPEWMKPCEQNDYALGLDYYTFNPFASGGREMMEEGGVTLYLTEIERQLKIVNESGGAMTSILRENIAERDQKIQVKQRGFQLNLFAQTSELQETREVLQYDMGQFFADVGALCGVWIGLSALSVVAIVNQIVKLISRCVRARRNLKTVKAG